MLQWGKKHQPLIQFNQNENSHPNTSDQNAIRHKSKVMWVDLTRYRTEKMAFCCEPLFSLIESPNVLRRAQACRRHRMMRTNPGCFLHTETASHRSPVRQSANLFLLYIVALNSHKKCSKMHHNVQPSVAAMITLSKRKGKGSNEVKGRKKDLNDCDGDTKRRSTRI